MVQEIAVDAQHVEDVTVEESEADGTQGGDGDEDDVKKGKNAAWDGNKHGQASQLVTIDTSMVASDASAAAKPSVEEPGSPNDGDSLRRKSSKVANLRAAFERQPSKRGHSPRSPDAGKLRFDLSPSRSRSTGREADMAKLREQEAELMRLRDRLEKETELRQAFEDKCTALEEELEDVQAQLAQRDHKWRAELSRRSNDLVREKDKSQGEAHTLQRQLFDLKKSIAAATRLESQIADSTFAQEMQHLCHETQNWVVNNFRRVKLDKTPEEMCARLESIAEPKQLEYLRPLFESFESSMKLSSIQAVTACYMMEIFEEPLLFGMPTDEEWRKSIKRAAETLPAVMAPASFNKWRAVTLEAIKQSADISQSLASASQSMSEMICITLNTLTDMEESQSRVSSLNAIVKRTVSLAHSFRVQRAQYEFSLPSPGASYDPDVMEDDSLEGDDAAECGIRCATFPSVVKRGDEDGDNEQLSNVVVKAKVRCKI